MEWYKIPVLLYLLKSASLVWESDLLVKSNLSMKKRILALSLFLFGSLSVLMAQSDGGRLSGNFQANANFFQRDSLIGAANTPQYDRQLYGAEGWLNLNYSNWGFDFGVRFDFFNNSNLLNPNGGSFSGEGIGRWYVQKRIEKFDIFAGYLYDQIGSGIIFRAYEQRPLLIDQALFGARLMYDLTPDWRVKVFSGRQKQQFDIYESVIKGGSIEGFMSLGENKPITLAPGIGVVNRTLDDNSMESLVSSINTYSPEDTFTPKYNTYAFTFFNTLTAGSFNWFLETSFKTDDNLNDFNPAGERFFLSSGSVLYTSVSYAAKGLGISLEAKRTENFSFRTRPQEQLLRGLINFLPPMTRLNTYRMTARYNAATQELGELAFQGDIRYAPSRKLSFNVNGSYITDLNDNLLYRELFTEINFKYKRLWSLLGGVQIQNYNQEVYEVKPGVPIVETIVPYFDFLYKFDRKTALRLEGQVMLTGKDSNGERHDYGNWIFALAEFSIAPHWSFSVSDMYNVGPGKNSPINESGEKLAKHYPRVDVFYTIDASRFSLSYIKQVEGVVCAGGICRLEPAFSGVRFSVQSSF